MPTYEYQCESCLTKFDVRRSFNDELPTYCPKCKREAQRLFSPVPIIFNGSGFYITDNRKNGSGPEKKKEAASTLEKRNDSN